MRFLLLALALGACHSSSGTDTEAALAAEVGEVQSAAFITNTSIPQNPAPNVNVTVADDRAREIYSTTLALPDAPAGPRSCPADFGVTYTISFTAGASQIAQAVVGPNGCQVVTISSSKLGLQLQASDEYFSELAVSLGIDEKTIYPYTPPS
jgi:hypothetical protein